MREILFRGKRKDNSEWVEGFLTVDPTICDYVIDIIGQCSILIYPSTIGQFTGLTDKNGKKIFEGDIHKNENNGKLFVIKFGSYYDEDFFDDIYGWYMEDTKGNRYALQGNEYEYANIIGNIYDNPELLKGGAE